MIDIPPECPSGVTFFDFTSQVVLNLNNGVKNPVYSCYLQTPDNLKDKDISSYPYFDFNSARKQNAEEERLQSLQASEISVTDFYLVILLGAMTFIAFAIGFATGFVYLE